MVAGVVYDSESTTHRADLPEADKIGRFTRQLVWAGARDLQCKARL